METVLLNIWMWGLLSVLVLIGIYHGWKGNKFFNSSIIAYIAFIFLLVAISFGLNLHSYSILKEMGSTIQHDPYRTLGNGLAGIIYMLIIYAIIYGICYLISGRKKAKNK